jgi:hypothetical protein
MALHWLRHYCFLDDVQLHAAKERRQQMVREIAALERKAWLEKYEQENSNS